MDPIKKEFASPAPMPQPRLHAHETHYSHYANPPPMEMPGKETHASLTTNPHYPSEMLPNPYHMAAGACMPEYMHYMPGGTHNNLSMAMRNMEGPQPQQNTFKIPSILRKERKGTANDLTACHLRTPCTSSSCQGGAGAGAHSSRQPTDEAIQKREIRLMKNREAARECRRKKKEYVRCLENRVAVLENQNKTLIDELRAIKEIYRHE